MGWMGQLQKFRNVHGDAACASMSPIAESCSWLHLQRAEAQNASDYTLESVQLKRCQMSHFSYS